MRTDYDLTGSQGTYRLRCAFCGREWHDSIVGKCPEREIHVCMYCCRRLCDKSYQSRLGGRGCRARDAARKKRKKTDAAGVPHQSPAGDSFPQGKPETGETPAAAGGRNDGKGDAA